jgi:hypothetical protein
MSSATTVHWQADKAINSKPVSRSDIMYSPAVIPVGHAGRSLFSRKRSTTQLKTSGSP